MTEAMRTFATTMLATITEQAEHAAPLLAAIDCGDPECQGHDQLVPPMVFLCQLDEDGQDVSLSAQVFVRPFDGQQEMDRAYGEVWAALAMVQPAVVLVANEVRKASDQAKALREAGIDIPPEEDVGASKGLEVCAVRHLGGVEFDVAAAMAEYHKQDDGSITFDEPQVWDKLPTQMAPALAALAAGVFGPPEFHDLSRMADMLSKLGHVVIVQAGEEGEL